MYVCVLLSVIYIYIYIYIHRCLCIYIYIYVAVSTGRHCPALLSPAQWLGGQTIGDALEAAQDCYVKY